MRMGDVFSEYIHVLVDVAVCLVHSGTCPYLFHPYLFRLFVLHNSHRINVNEDIFIYTTQRVLTRFLRIRHLPRIMRHNEESHAFPLAFYLFSLSFSLSLQLPHNTPSRTSKAC